MQSLLVNLMSLSLRKFLIVVILLGLLGPGLLGLLSSKSFAQQSVGSIKGNVSDQVGGLIVGATVIARGANGQQRKTVTSQNGNFEFKSLPAGFYDLKAVAEGFDAFEQKQIEVKSGRATSFDFQLNIASVEQSVTIEDKGVSTDSDRNANAIVLGERELQALPDDPDALSAALQALAGPPQGENGPQIKVDGFSNGQIPSKDAIREVRVNQNPFSAENEFPGWGGIEIFTQPGSDKFHGGVGFNFNDESLNSRNPFAPVRAPYQQRSFNANLTGPVKPKRASFSFDAGRNAIDSNSIINATVLNPVTLTPERFNQTVVTPQAANNFNGRVDLKINKKHTLVGGVSYGQFSQALQGIGGFSLPSRAVRGARTYFNLQLTETTVLTEKAINETRFQIGRTTFRQTAILALPALNVSDAFLGGGSQVGASSNQQNRAELQNFTSWSSGNHFLKIGGRLRYAGIRSISPSNFGGTYIFGGGNGPALDSADQVIPGVVAISSLERYRRTLIFQRQGLTAVQIRALGGGPTQLSIAGGDPEVSVTQRDIGFFVQDEWKLRPNFTISPGLRYENQTNISSDWDFAPRIGFAWSPAFGGGKEQPGASAKPAGGGRNKTVVRGGFGVFYNRVGEDITMQTLRFNGVNQQQFIVSDPAILALFPAVPPISALEAFAVPQSRRVASPDLAPSASFRGSVSLEHQLPHNVKLSLNYAYYRTLRNMRFSNINAPLGGTFSPGQSGSGTRPLGASAGNVFQYQSNGRLVSNSFGVNFSVSGKKLNAWANYAFNKTNSNDGGTSGSISDAYDFSHEWGRANFDTRHWFYASSSYQAPFGISVNTFLVITSGSPFNITTGRDTNGDTFFSERPAFATDLSKPGVVKTPLGAFDPNPGPGQQVIPRNFGEGPAFMSMNFGLSKTIRFGPAIAPATVVRPGQVTANAANGGTTAGAAKPASAPPVRRPYALLLSINVSNILNHANIGTPIGNMASPLFLKSTGSPNVFFFGPGGGGAGGNRQISLRVRFSF